MYIRPCSQSKVWGWSVFPLPHSNKLIPQGPLLLTPPKTAVRLSFASLRSRGLPPMPYVGFSSLLHCWLFKIGHECCDFQHFEQQDFFRVFFFLAKKEHRRTRLKTRAENLLFRENIFFLVGLVPMVSISSKRFSAPPPLTLTPWHIPPPPFRVVP